MFRIEIIEVIRFQWVSYVSMRFDHFQLPLNDYYERIHRYVICEVFSASELPVPCIHTHSDRRSSYDKYLGVICGFADISNSLNDYCFSIMLDYDKSRRFYFGAYPELVCSSHRLILSAPFYPKKLMRHFSKWFNLRNNFSVFIWCYWVLDRGMFP